MEENRMIDGEGSKGMTFRSVEFNTVGKDIPQYKESVNPRGGFINFGEDNLMPNYYISLIDRSPKHNAIIHQKSAMISGNGWIKNGLSNEALKFISNQMNDDDLEEIVSRVGYDLEVFGAFCLNIVWSKDRTKIAEINYMNPQTLRIVKPDSDYPQVEQYMINKDWSSPNKQKINQFYIQVFQQEIEVMLIKSFIVRHTKPVNTSTVFQNTYLVQDG